MNWQNKRVLVTGAGGFIGGHLTDRLVREGASVRAFVRNNSQNTIGCLADLSPDVMASVEVIPGSILEPEALESAVRGTDCVFHLAAIISIPYSYLHPRQTYDTNQMGTLNVLNAVNKHSVPRAVITSTSEVYGTALRVPIDEDHPLQGQSPYAASKIAADKVAESYYLSFDTPVAIARPFNTYGPRQSLRAVIPVIITQALGGGEILLGETTSTRDFTFVADTAEGFLRIAACDEALGQPINIGTGQEISILQLAETIAAVVGTECRIKQDPQRIRPDKSEVRRLCAGTELARRVLGWSPGTDLRTGLEATIKWFRGRSDAPTGDQYVI